MSLTLKTAKNMIRRMRINLDDQEKPVFWSDNALLTYIDEAQTEFCRPDIGRPIVDSRTPEVCEIPYNANDTELELHESVIRILSAFRDDNDGSGKLHKLAIGTETSLLAQEPIGDDYGNAVAPGISLTTAGPVYKILVDYDEAYIRLANPADKAGILRLRVHRYPIEPILKCEDTFEVKRQYLMAVKAWANYLAYMDQDAEKFDEKAAARWKDRFLELAAMAQTDQVRQQSPPQPMRMAWP